MFRFTIRDLLWLMVVVGMCCPSFAQTTKQAENARPNIEELKEIIRQEPNGSVIKKKALGDLGRRYPDEMKAIRLLVESIDEPPSPAPLFTQLPLEHYTAANALLTCSHTKVRTAIFDSAGMRQSERQLHMKAYILAQLDQEYERPFDVDVTVLRLTREIRRIDAQAWRLEDEQRKSELSNNLRRMIAIMLEPLFQVRRFPEPTDK